MIFVFLMGLLGDKQLEKEVTEMIQAAQRVRSLMKGGIADGKSSDG